MVMINSSKQVTQNEDEKQDLYESLIQLVGCLHRQLHDVLKYELDRVGHYQINAAQAMLLFNMREHSISVTELRERGQYQGSNISYNLKKLVEQGFITSETSKHDRRTQMVTLTDKGMMIKASIDSLFQRQYDNMIATSMVAGQDFEVVLKKLGRLNRFWEDQIKYRL